MKQFRNDGSENEIRGSEKLNEGQEKGNNKIVITPRPVIKPAPQSPVPEQEKTTEKK
jgi:hypothetical protein